VKGTSKDNAAKNAKILEAEKRENERKEKSSRNGASPAGAADAVPAEGVQDATTGEAQYESAAEPEVPAEPVVERTGEADEAVRTPVSHEEL
jgi:hypothetical protein